MTLTTFRKQLVTPNHLFADTLAFIEQHYHFQPSAFTNGDVANAKGQNEGSCKVLAFALLEGLTDEEALLAFAEHYRSVLNNPLGSDHQNIRALQKNGLKSVTFEVFPLTKAE